MTYAAPPEYPDIARQAGIEGTVTVRVHVDIQGRVTAADIVDGPVPLHEAALAASFNYLFVPARRDCTAVEADTAIPVVFHLTRSCLTAGRH